MTKKKQEETHTTSDSALFKTAISGTRPLKKNNNAPPAQNQIKNIRVQRHLKKETHSYPLSDFSGEFNQSTADEALAYRGNGIQQNLFKKLRNGQIAIESRLDLHGFTVDDARTLLSQFISDSIDQRCRCIIIIHGKGSHGGPPVLKTMLNHWLKQIPDVLAFSSTQPQDGGTGALYVLLRTKFSALSLNP